MRTLQHYRDGLLSGCLEAAFRSGQPAIWNSDQGSQFTAAYFLPPLKQRGVSISVDGRGRALDNVFIERLWRSLKYELVYPGDFVSGTDLFQALQRYFYFYNHQPPHQALGYGTICSRSSQKGRSHRHSGGPRPHAPGIYRSFLQSGWFFFGAFRLYPGGQLKSIEWLQKHRKKLPQSLWSAEGVTPIKDRIQAHRNVK